MIWAEHEPSCHCEVSLLGQLHLYRIPSKSPPGALFPSLGSMRVNLNFLHSEFSSFSGAFMPLLSSLALPGRDSQERRCVTWSFSASRAGLKTLLSFLTLT